jgi:hypothetical protein
VSSEGQDVELCRPTPLAGLQHVQFAGFLGLLGSPDQCRCNRSSCCCSHGGASPGPRYAEKNRVEHGRSQRNSDDGYITLNPALPQYVDFFAAEYELYKRATDMGYTPLVW